MTVDDLTTLPRLRVPDGARARPVGLVASADAGALVRLIAGDVAGRHGPGSTHTRITMLHASVLPGARLIVPWPAEFNALAYALAGDGFVGAEPARAARTRRPADP